MLKQSRGGARKNAGRPTIIDKAKSRTIRLNNADYAKFKLLGGLKWLRDFLNAK